MPKNDNSTLFVFIDESGNLDFGPKGTQNFVLAAAITTDPILSAKKLQQLKYQYLEKGIDIEYFHASEDKQNTRSQVLSTISTIRNKIRIHYIHTKKETVNKPDLSPTIFYAKLGTILTKHILESYPNDFSQIIIIFDKCLRGKEQNAFLKHARPTLKATGKPYKIYFHRTLSDFNGQIADYFAWSKYVSLERCEDRPLAAISNVDQTDTEIFLTKK